MNNVIPIIFIVGYAAIAFEHTIKINKTASALLTGVLCWVIYILGSSDTSLVIEQLYDHFGQISSILFFLLGAMTIVELVDLHDGFKAITSRIKTTHLVSLLWIIGTVTFFLSAVLDNLTTTIVMISLIRKLLPAKKERMLFAGVIIIAANAGGAWSPIGDVTTTMLWISGQITSNGIIASLFFPSLVCLIIPLSILSFQLRGKQTESVLQNEKTVSISHLDRNLILMLGIGALVFVPFFKTLTHLPPFMGILFGLSILWIATEIIHKNKNDEDKNTFSVVHALRKADVPSVLFFLGILIAISALESTKQLALLAGYMDDAIGNMHVIVVSMGLLSAIVDNVPLVAASMGMYNMQTFPADHEFWHFIAYCAGTGGSCLLIGSAAGVAAMGMEKIDFFWYLKNIAFLALLGYLGGAAMFLVQQSM